MSADLIDNACDREDQDRADALAYRKPELPRIGLCYFCESEIASDQIFCKNSGCAEDYETKQRLLKIAGRKL